MIMMKKVERGKRNQKGNNVWDLELIYNSMGVFYLG
jgi:hypothetical protein